MKIFKTLMFGAAGFLLASSTAFASVLVTIHDGRVSIVAKDAIIRQILTEWARVGQTKIVNLERIAGGPMSLELHDVPESQALDIVLRSVAGYLAAPRPVAVANLSVFDRVVVMPQPAGARTPVPRSPRSRHVPAAAPVQSHAGAGLTMMAIGRRTASRPTKSVAVGVQHVSTATAGQPQEQRSSQHDAAGTAGAPSAFPTAPYGGVAVPGMVAPAPPPGLPRQVLDRCRVSRARFNRAVSNRWRLSMRWARPSPTRCASTIPFGWPHCGC